MDMFTKFGMIFVALAISVGLIIFAMNVLKAEPISISNNDVSSINAGKLAIVNRLRESCNLCLAQNKNTNADCHAIEIENTDPDFTLGEYVMFNSNDFIKNGKNIVKISAQDNNCKVSVFE